MIKINSRLFGTILILLTMGTVAHSAAFAPPAKYDYNPRQPVVVREYDFAKLRHICWVATGVQADACTLPNHRGKCIIYMPIRNTLNKREWTALYRHERAHCNGWKHF